METTPSGVRLQGGIPSGSKQLGRLPLRRGVTWKPVLTVMSTSTSHESLPHKLWTQQKSNKRPEMIQNQPNCEYIARNQLHKLPAPGQCWLEVKILRSITSAIVLRWLDSVFAVHRYSKQIKSDNASYFTSTELRGPRSSPGVSSSRQ